MSNLLKICFIYVILLIILTTDVKIIMMIKYIKSFFDIIKDVKALELHYPTLYQIYQDKMLAYKLIKKKKKF